MKGKLGMLSAVHQIRSRFTNSACNVLPRAAGLRSTMTPAASNAEIFESAPPLPPLTIAPGSRVSTDCEA